MSIQDRQQGWKAIWARRTWSGTQVPDLAALIGLDGYYVGAGRIEPEDWQENADRIAARIGLVAGSSVFEVGCGSGAFLYALRRGLAVEVGGIDYSEALIAAATSAMPDGEFHAGDARTLDDARGYDFVISNGVFHYFPLETAAEVLARMVRKARVAVAVTEVPDAATRDESERYRRGQLPQAEYDRKYAGLEHTYFARGWFGEQARALGCECEVFDGCVPNYGQNRFRFGAVLRKAAPASTRIS